MCIYIYNFGISYNTLYRGYILSWPGFCLHDPYSYSLWRMLGAGPVFGASFPPHRPTGPHFCPLGHFLRVLCQNRRSLSRQFRAAGAELTLATPPAPPREAWSQSQSSASKTDCPRYQIRLLSSASHVCWRGFGVLPAPRPPSGKRRWDPPGIRTPGEEGSHCPPSTLAVAPERGQELPQPPSSWEPPKSTPYSASTSHPPISGPRQAPKTKVPSSPGVLPPASCLSPPPGPVRRKDRWSV